MSDPVDLRTLARSRLATSLKVLPPSTETARLPHAVGGLTVSPKSHADETGEITPPLVVVGVEHELVTLACRIRVAVRCAGGVITGVKLLIRDDARQRLVDGVDARLRAGVGLAVQAVEQVALADLIRELRLIEINTVTATAAHDSERKEMAR